jgi:hypothetical protein
MLAWQKWDRDLAHRYLPSKHKALSSNPSASKKEKRRKKNTGKNGQEGASPTVVLMEVQLVQCF